jgi:hypothetical protein
VEPFLPVEEERMLQWALNERIRSSSIDPNSVRWRRGIVLGWFFYYKWVE